VFHDTDPAGVDLSIDGGGISSCPRELLSTSGCPCRSIHSRSRLPRGEPRRRSALAEDPREPSQDRFDHRPVKARRLSRPGAPSLDEDPSRAFLRASGFATTARSLVALFPTSDGSPASSPLATARKVSLPSRFVRTDDAHRLLQYDSATRGQTAHLSTPAIGSTLGCSSSPLVSFLRKHAERAGQRDSQDCSRAPIWIEHLGVRTHRAGRSVALLRRYPCTPCRAALAGGGVEEPRAALERRDPASAPSRERERFHTSRGAFRPQESATPAGIAPIRLLRLASHSVRCPTVRWNDAGREGPAPTAVGLSLSPLTDGGEIPARRQSRG